MRHSVVMSRPRTVVLLEGATDAAAVRVAAASLHRSLDDVDLVDLGGVTNVGKALDRLQQAAPGPVVLGLCDAGEVHVVRRALQRGQLAPVDLAERGFFVCSRDLEDELIRALGVARALTVVESVGLAEKFATLQQQPAWIGQPVQAQLHRFCGVASGRKLLLATAFAEALPASDLPEPLTNLVTRLPV